MSVLGLLFDGRGRMGRGRYLAGLGLLLLTLLSLMVVSAVLGARPEVQVQPWKGIAMLVALLAAFWSWLAMSAKRLRDIDQSPWWTGLFLVPGVGFGAVTLILLCFPGSDGENSYGPPPPRAA